MLYALMYEQTVYLDTPTQSGYPIACTEQRNDPWSAKPLGDFVELTNGVTGHTFRLPRRDVIGLVPNSYPSVPPTLHLGVRLALSPYKVHILQR